MSGAESLSVIIPAYNAARYLGEAIASVLAENYPALHVIIVNDGSTDDTAQVAARFGARVTVLSQPNRGVGAAMNLGLDAAQGEWLAFCAADDVWEPGRLAKQFAAFRQQPAPDIVFGHVQNFFSPDMPAADRARYVCPPKPLPGLMVTAMLLRRATFERVGHFRAEYTMGEFLDWYARAQELPLRIALIPDVVLRRRIHGKNLSIRAQTERGDFARVLKAAMDRRRQTQQQATK